MTDFEPQYINYPDLLPSHQFRLLMAISAFRTAPVDRFAIKPSSLATLRSLPATAPGLLPGLLTPENLSI
jgi:hypothetical protein